MTATNATSTPQVGTAAKAVNSMFSGPDHLGTLNDVPPLVHSGIEAAPLIAINGVNTPKLGIAGPESPKTHG